MPLYIRKFCVFRKLKYENSTLVCIDTSSGFLGLESAKLASHFIAFSLEVWKQSSLERENKEIPSLRNLLHCKLEGFMQQIFLSFYLQLAFFSFLSSYFCVCLVSNFYLCMKIIENLSTFPGIEGLSHILCLNCNRKSQLLDVEYHRTQKLWLKCIHSKAISLFYKVLSNSISLKLSAYLAVPFTFVDNLRLQGCLKSHRGSANRRPLPNF